MIRTRVNEILGIEHPIIQAGMGGVARWKLAAAVSNAGGLGVLGMAFMTPDYVREQVRAVKDHTDKPYGVDLLLAEGAPMIEEVMAVLFEEKVPVFVSGLGDPGPWSEKMRARGMKIIALVGNVRQARRCAPGVDIVVAQGHEAGGHTGRIPSFVLAPLVVDAIRPVPVVLAGGVGDGRALAAALMLGAEGVLVGTRFIASEEANCHDGYKEKLVAISEEGTVVTRAYTGKPCRVVKNQHTEEWAKKEGEIKPFPQQLMLVGDRRSSGVQEGDGEFGMMAAGQISGMIEDRPSAAAIVERMVGEAEELLARAPGYVAAGAEAK